MSQIIENDSMKLGNMFENSRVKATNVNSCEIKIDIIENITVKQNTKKLISINESMVRIWLRNLYSNRFSLNPFKVTKTSAILKTL